MHLHTDRRSSQGRWKYVGGSDLALQAAAPGLTAALVAPAHVQIEARVSTVPVLTEYHTRSQVRPKGGQQ
jgi:hypothetical protein